VGKVQTGGERGLLVQLGREALPLSCTVSWLTALMLRVTDDPEVLVGS